MALVQFMRIPKAYADCEPIYGGGTTCQPSSMVVTKTVLNPQTNVYVHDLGINDPLFHPGDPITFQISVTNIGTRDLGHVAVTDNLPGVITFVAGESGIGTFDSSTNTFSFFFPGVAPGQTVSLILTGHIVDASHFPTTQDGACVTNQAVATNGEVTSQDSTQFCIFHPVTGAPAPITTVPPSTGAQPIPLLSLLGITTTGAILLRLTRKERSNV